MNRLISPAVCATCRCYPCRCPILRREPCACGLWIEAERDNERSVQLAVERHVKSPVHELWAQQNGLRPEKEQRA